MPVARRFSGVFERPEIAWVALALALLVTCGLWRASLADFERRAAERFLYRAEKQQVALVERMNDYEQVLRGAAALFAASEWVAREEWQRYVAGLGIDQSLPGIQGTGFALMVTPGQKAAHESALRAEGFAGYAIRPAGERPVYSSIIYLEPFAGRNLRAFGYDMFSEPTRREAMERARDTGQPALSAVVRLVQETNVDVQPGFLIYLPVYRAGMATATVAERRDALLGFVYSPFRAHDLMGRIFEDPSRDIDVELYDGALAPDRLLFRSEPAGRQALHTIDLPIPIAGHLWIGRFSSSVRFEALVANAQPTIILLTGLCVSALLFAVLYLHARHSRQLESQVRARTRELEAAKDAAEGANRAKTAFLATVSHELRTPLNPIIGFSGLMLDNEDSGLTPEERRQAGIIRQCGEQLLEIIDEILDISSIEAGHVAIDLKPAPLCSLLQEQCDAMRAQAQEAHLELRLVECADSITVLADGRRLRQVVRNLLANAIKFTDHGSVTVRAVVAGDQARIEVEDTGIGIAPDQQAGLFQRFHRIASPNRKRTTGTGLGLAISRRLVEAMAGQIGVVSEPGRGSRFWFTLPLTAAQGTKGA